MGRSFWGGSPSCEVTTVKKQCNTAENKRKTVPLLQTPTDEDLSIVFSMFLCYGRDDGVVEHLLPSLDERTVCLYDDVVLLAIIHDLPLLAERMQLTRAKRFGISREAVTWKYNQRPYLDLVHSWGLEPRLGNFFEVVNATT